MELVCEYCNKQFSTKYSLAHHVKTSKICIKSRSNKEPTIVIQKCNHCSKEFLRKDYLTSHLKICPEKKNQETEKTLKDLDEAKKKILEYEIKLDIIKKEMKDTDELPSLRSKALKLTETTKALNKAEYKIRKLENENAELKRETENLKIELSDREGFIKGLAKSSKNVTKNYNYKPKFAKIDTKNVQPLTEEIVEKKIFNYTYENFKKGTVGLSDFIVYLAGENNPEIPKLNYVCTDTSRLKFYRLDEDKCWIKDPTGSYITTIFRAIKPHVEKHFNHFHSWEKKKMIEEAASKKIHSEFGRVDIHFAENKIDQITFTIKPIHSSICLDDAPSKDTLIKDLKKEISEKLAI